VSLVLVEDVLARLDIVSAAGRDGATLYTLRHSHASALHYAGFTPLEEAARMGYGLAHLRPRDAPRSPLPRPRTR
jgi:hypothetical protein